MSHKKALSLSWFTILYNLVEGVVSVLFGYFAGSAALIGFGMDSFIESLSASVLVWRFSKHEGISEAEAERREKKAIRLIAYTFFILGFYVLYESFSVLIFREVPDPSLVGIIIALLSIIIMPIVFLMKKNVGRSLGSKSVIADAKQTLACILLSFALLLGLALNYIWEIWWADPVAGVVIAFFILKEGYNIIQKEKLCMC